VQRPPAQDLLRSLVTAIRTVLGDEQSITVSMEVADSLPDTFEAAFTPDPVPAAASGVLVTFTKIGR